MARTVKVATTQLQLSAREREVLALLSDGYKNEEVAKQLNLSRRTVEAHRARIMLKIGITTLPGLVKYALSNGITLLDHHRGEKF